MDLRRRKKVNALSCILMHRSMNVVQYVVLQSHYKNLVVITLKNWKIRAMHTAHTRYCSRFFFRQSFWSWVRENGPCVYFFTFGFKVAKNSCGLTFIGMLFNVFKWRLHWTTLYLNGWWCYVLRLHTADRHYMYPWQLFITLLANTLIAHKNKNHV